MDADRPSLFRRPPLRAAALVVALGALSALCYANSFTAEFALDNKLVILRDPRLQAFTTTTLKQIFSESYWWPTLPSDLYRPLTTLSYLFNYTVLGNGPRPAGYHVVNFLLHWANAALVLGLVRGIGGSLPVAAGAATIFALHPVAVEAVTNVVGRADLLAALFVLLAAHAHLRSAGATGRTARAAWLTGVAACSTAGVLCKENAVMIVGVVLLYDALCRWPALEGPERQRLLAALKRFVLPDCLALAPMLAVFSLARLHFATAALVQWHPFVDNPIAGAGAFQGFMTALKVQGLYLGLLLFPARLTCDYSYNHIPLYGTGDVAGDAIAWASVATAALLLVLAWRSRRRCRLLAYGILLYLGLMLPAANLLQTIGSIMAERFCYLPSVGFALVAALGLEALGGRLAKSRDTAGRSRAVIFGGLLACVAAALGARTLVRNGDWATELRLWQSAVRVAPDSFKTHKNHAQAILAADPTEAGLDAAIAEAEKGLAILDRPEIERHVERRETTLFVDLGHCYALKAEYCLRRGDGAAAGRFNAQAIAVLQRAVEVDAWIAEESRRRQLAGGTPPGDLRAAGRPQTHLDLAIVLLRTGRFDEALARAAQASRLDPFAPESRVAMASALQALGRPEEAAVQLLTALIIDADAAQPWNELRGVDARLEPGATLVKTTAVGKPRLAADQPRVRRDLNRAFAEYVRSLQAGNHRAEAERIRQIAVRDYGCPPEIFR